MFFRTREKKIITLHLEKNYYDLLVRKRKTVLIHAFKLYSISMVISANMRKKDDIYFIFTRNTISYRCPAVHHSPRVLALVLVLVLVHFDVPRANKDDNLK